LFNLNYHQTRFDLARKTYFSCTDKIELSGIITIPESYQKGLYRCRVLYTNTIESVEFLAHEYKKTESLRLVEDHTIDYRFKYSDRKKLNLLFEKRGDCDDILIVKNGCITDSWTANAIFYDGHSWWTPDTPLLPGTQRAKLIDEGKLHVCRITPSDLSNYKKAGLINALQDMDDMPLIPIKNIVY
jgi:4-amino-4-deoxychorismate lyase